MNAIVAFSFLMKENSSSNNTENEDFSNQILNSCEQLIGLFDSFLDSAIIDTDNYKIDLKVCKLDNILDEPLSEFREVIRKNDRKDLELITEIQFNNSSEILIDKTRVIRVIQSLFQNSLRNTKSGYIKIGYYLQDEKAVFYVLDSGQGYFKCKEYLQNENINESLSKYDDTYTAINTNLIKNLIQIMGGTIWIECNGLSGAGIYFSVPAKIVSSSQIKIKKFINSMIAI
jgi:K+-sensing histidine kinase KdpD